MSEFIMRSLVYDSVPLTNEINYEVFVDRDDQEGERIIKKLESETLKWFFNHPVKFATYLFFEELNIEENLILLEVKKPVIIDDEKPGDIDILVVNPQKPNLAIGFQVKRIACVIDERDQPIMKTKAISTGVHQTRKMFDKYRFYKNYLMIILVCDGRFRSHSQQMFRHLSYFEKLPIFNYPSLKELREEIGIFYLEINQPSANDINYTARISSKLLKPSHPVDQLARTSENIDRLLNKKFE